MARTSDESSHGRAGRRVLAHACCACLMWLLVANPGLHLRAEPPRSSKSSNDLAAYDALITPEDRGHWAFQTVKSPAIPAVKNTAWARNPIDRFVLAKQEEQGLVPAPVAEPRALVRRLFLDLTGLPPNPEECASFLEDAARSADAVEK